MEINDPTILLPWAILCLIKTDRNSWKLVGIPKVAPRRVVKSLSLVITRIPASPFITQLTYNTLFAIRN